MREGQITETGTGCRNGSGIRAIRVGALAALTFVAPVIAAAAPVSHKEVRIPRVDRRAIENLQRWVNGGHDAWCKDAREVALAELRRVAPEFSGDRFDLASLPLSVESKSAKRAVFDWASLDGSATYRITVERFDWLKPVASGVSGTVWVPSRVEIVRTEQRPPARRSFPEIPRA
jgi:hypothetical protein